MAFEMIILDADGRPMLAGLRLVLLGDGRVVGVATVESDGRVAFDGATDGISRFSVRLESVEDPSVSDSVHQALIG